MKDIEFFSLLLRIKLKNIANLTASEISRVSYYKNCIVGETKNVGVEKRRSVNGALDRSLRHERNVGRVTLENWNVRTGAKPRRVLNPQPTRLFLRVFEVRSFSFFFFFFI